MDALRHMNPLATSQIVCTSPSPPCKETRECTLGLWPLLCPVHEALVRDVVLSSIQQDGPCGDWLQAGRDRRHLRRSVGRKRLPCIHTRQQPCLPRIASRLTRRRDVKGCDALVQAPGLSQHACMRCTAMRHGSCTQPCELFERCCIRLIAVLRRACGN